MLRRFWHPSEAVTQWFPQAQLERGVFPPRDTQELGFAKHSHY
jgi:hypothetical protein